ncbi:hypothetical protein CKAH01_12482 [Colletotrichum kahawae]|uniref:Uncharacterized protein n=1 Tax=Colletotrichum kahawae TaxID=34407 RepID=A0AAE0DB29_COLKA|nr:hypothetical protein CKAH01_12482 [Colletotrichum kahawae]
MARRWPLQSTTMRSPVHSDVGCALLGFLRRIHRCSAVRLVARVFPPHEAEMQPSHSIGNTDACFHSNRYFQELA